jgi:hypothetical protein
MVQHMQAGYISLRPGVIPMRNGKRPVKRGGVGQRTPTGPSHFEILDVEFSIKYQVKSVTTEPLSKSSHSRSLQSQSLTTLSL